MGNDVDIFSPETAVEVLKYVHTIAPKAEYDLGAFAFESARWANKYCANFEINLIAIADQAGGSLTQKQQMSVTVALAEICNAIVETSKTPPAIREGLDLYYSATYNPPDNDRTKKELGPIFEGVTTEAKEFVALTSMIKEYGVQVLQAPYWIYDGLYIRLIHDLKRERSHQQKASDIEETRRINAEVLG